MEIKQNYELKKHTTFKIGGEAKCVYFPKTVDELVELLTKKEKPILLGSCSNVLISSYGIDDEVIITSKITQYSFEGNRLTTSCGTKGPLLSKECYNLGLSGLEFMIGFPGSIGGMIYMNASAHNQAISDNFVSCKVFDLDTKKVLSLKRADMNFKYRKSILSEKNYILLSADFEFKEDEKEKINEMMQKNLEFRKTKQPSLVLPNVGSSFKNPENDSAGRLLDQAGAKGLEVGGAKVWENHANFIVNFNNSTSKDVLNLMLKMYDIVREKYSIELQPEVKFIGKRDEEEVRIWNILNKENTH